MGEVRAKLTVYFEEPFWVGVFERIEDDKLSAAKITFGTEPKDNEVYDFVLKHYYGLQFSPAVKSFAKEKKANPKKMLRDIKNSMKEVGIGTKSQQALKLQQEQNKLERKQKSRAQKQAIGERMFELKQLKKKEKHRGR